MFPRDSKVLRFRLEERDRQDSGDWRELGTFVLPNPRPARVQPWVAAKAPHFQFPPDLDIQIGEVTVSKERINRTDIWETAALLPMRVTQHGQILTNWVISESQVWDASGNFGAFSGPKTVTNDWIVYRGFRPLDPAKPWRFKVAFGVDSDFPATNLHSFTLAWPMGGVVQTNFGGFPVRISSSGPDYLIVEMMQSPKDARLTLVGAENEQGEVLYQASGSWGQHNFRRSLEMWRLPSGKLYSGKLPTTVHVTIAIHPVYWAEFTVQPVMK